MKVAQAQHARAHYADAGDWARRALALEDADPDAYVILAHAERRAGHPAAVRNAYHQYLLLAPRGWHASEARAALRGGGPARGLDPAGTPSAPVCSRPGSPWRWRSRSGTESPTLLRFVGSATLTPTLTATGAEGRGHSAVREPEGKAQIV